MQPGTSNLNIWRNQIMNPIIKINLDNAAIEEDPEAELEKIFEQINTLTEGYTPEEQARAQQQEDRIKESQDEPCEMADNTCLGPYAPGTGLAKDLWFCYTHRRFGAKMEVEPASDRYTKDLEDMLRRIVTWYEDREGGKGPYLFHDLVDEAKALLGRTDRD